MDTKVEKAKRFITFIKKDSTTSCLAFTLYFLIMPIFMDVSFPLILDVIYTIAYAVVGFLCLATCFIKKQCIFEKKEETGIKKILKEILMYIPVILLSIFINFLLVEHFGGKSANQSSLDESFKEYPIWFSITTVILAPIIEEFIFRFLPYKFIKNKILYILLSTVVFATMHVSNDPYAFYFIWFYMTEPLYYGYRYHKTKNIWVTVLLHSLHNLICLLAKIFS